MEEKDEGLNEALRELGIEGSIRFTIKANNTPENSKVHEEFKVFCRAETNNDYTQGLKKLLEYYMEDYKFSILAERIEALETNLNKLLETKSKKKDKDENEVF